MLKQHPKISRLVSDVESDDYVKVNEEQLDNQDFFVAGGSSGGAAAAVASGCCFGYDDLIYISLRIIYFVNI